jgi:hypothetical protein
MLYQGGRNERHLSCSDGVNIRDDDMGPAVQYNRAPRSRPLLPRRELHSTRLEVLRAGLRAGQTRV